MTQPSDEWFVSREGQRFGPVTFQQLVEAARAGRLEPRTDLIFGSGMTDWLPAGDVEGVFERAKPVARDPRSYAPPGDSIADSGSYDHRKQPKLNLPGATRLGYFLGTTVLPGVLFVGLMMAMPELVKLVGEKFAMWVPLVMLVIPLLVTVVTVKRFQNLAMSGWWWFGLMIPLLNLWLGYRLFACPTGYGYTRKMDGIGIFLALIYWLVPVAMVAAFFLAGPQIQALRDSPQYENLADKIKEMAAEAGEMIPKGTKESKP